MSNIPLEFEGVRKLGTEAFQLAAIKAWRKNNMGRRKLSYSPTPWLFKYDNWGLCCLPSITILNIRNFNSHFPIKNSSAKCSKNGLTIHISCYLIENQMFSLWIVVRNYTSTIHILGKIQIFYYMREYRLELIIKCFHIVTISETLCFCRGNSLFLP